MLLRFSRKPVLLRVAVSKKTHAYPSASRFQTTMLLTNCAACARPLAHDAPRCIRCKMRYCDQTCQHDHWRRGHKQMCKKIHRGGNAEQYHADKKYKQAVAIAAEICADDTKGQTYKTREPRSAPTKRRRHRGAHKLLATDSLASEPRGTVAHGALHITNHISPPAPRTNSAASTAAAPAAPCSAADS